MDLIAEPAALLRRYRQLRATMRDLHTELMDTLPKDTYTACGQKLGLLVGGMLVFDSEDELTLLMDYCLYDGWSGQHNAVTRFLARQPYAPGTDQALLLDAMSRARYSLFEVESVAEGLGVNCRDLLRGDGGSIVDECLGSTAVPGVIVAGRVVVLPELTMTSGAALAFRPDVLEDIRRTLEDGALAGAHADFNNLAAQEESELSATILRSLLARGRPSRATTPGPGGGAEFSRIRQSATRRTSRNEPCPCGSGRK